MKKYFVCHFELSDESKKEEVEFSCLFQVVSVRTTFKNVYDYIIKKVLIDNSKGLLVFRSFLGRFLWGEKSDRIRFSRIRYCEYEDCEDTIFEADNDEEAILWYKLNCLMHRSLV